ncbi:hypothetical protein [Eubacterium ramulus]|nr:hypothetical protein [Eubacterium ramulus]
MNKKKLKMDNFVNSLKPLTVQPDWKPRLNSVVSAKLFRRGNS